MAAQKKTAASQEIEELRGAVAQQGEAISDMADTVNALAGIVKDVVNSTKAKDNIVVKNRYAESEEMDQGQDNVERIQTQHVNIEIPGHIDPNSPEFKDKAEKEKFLRGKVTVEVHTSNNELDDPRFNIFVNGEPFLFVRGKKHEVPRYAVEGLASCVPYAMKSEPTKNNEGLAAYRYKATSGLRYPFSLVNPSPQDTRWLEGLMRRPK